MPSLSPGNEQLIPMLKARGDALSLLAATEIERLLHIWEYNNSVIPEMEAAIAMTVRTSVIRELEASGGIPRG